MMHDTSAPILSPYPPECLPTDVIGQGPRTSWQAVPCPLDLTVAQTVGTVWCNVHSGRFVRIREITMAEGGRRAPIYKALDPNDAMSRQAAPVIGAWQNEGYAVLHWVRVDHLGLNDQLSWRARATEHVAEKIAGARATVQQMRVQRADWLESAYRTARKKLLREINDLLFDLEEERAILRAFAEAHSLVAPPEVFFPATTGGEIGPLRPPAAGYWDWSVDRARRRPLAPVAVLEGRT